ncbi:MAG: potassium transporter TrkA [Acidimicrobiia bacterium]
MHVVIVGCGRVGAELADRLEELGHTVAIIDKNPRARERLHKGSKARFILGRAFDQDVLDEAGIKEADIFVAVTNGDNSNIVSARVASEFYKVPRVVARIYDPRRATIYERLGISTVATVAWTTDQIMARILPTEASDEWTMGSGGGVVITLPAPRHLIGESLKVISEPSKWSVFAVTRGGRTFFPDERTLMQENDLLHIAVLREYRSELTEALEPPRDGI